MMLLGNLFRALPGLFKIFPLIGSLAHRQTEVKVAYDNSAIYVAAYMHDDPKLIRKQITPVMGNSKTTWIIFQFSWILTMIIRMVFNFSSRRPMCKRTPGLDPISHLDFGSYGDRTWDAVWESKVAIVRRMAGR